MSFLPDGRFAGFTARAVLGDEINFSLRTADAAFAKRRQAFASEAPDRFLAALGTIPEPLTMRERQAIAGVAYRNLMEQFEKDPGAEGSASADGWRELQSQLGDGLRYFNMHGDGIRASAG